MGIVWFLLSSHIMITVYVLLDGFDLGAVGAIHLIVVRRPDEETAASSRQRWPGAGIAATRSGLEVAAGGTLYFALSCPVRERVQWFLSAAWHDWCCGC